MSQENESQAKTRKPFSKRTILIAIGFSLLVAIVSFIVLAVLPPPKGPFFEAPLRSFLTGLGLFGVACPPLIVGALMKKRAQASPYFEEGFIRAGFNLFGLVCLVLGLTCTGLSLYAIFKRLLGSG